MIKLKKEKNNCPLHAHSLLALLLFVCLLGFVVDVIYGGLRG